MNKRTLTKTQTLLICTFLVSIHVVLGAVTNAFASQWDNLRGPYGGDRRDIVIDHLNLNIIFTCSSDDSGVWVSKTAAEPTGNPANLAWQHTKLDRGYTTIAGTHHITEPKTYIYAVVYGDLGFIHRLVYSLDPSDPEYGDPRTKAWEDIQFGPSDKKVIQVITDPNRPEMVYVLAYDLASFNPDGTPNLSTAKTEVFYSSDYGASWQELIPAAFPYNTTNLFIIKDFVPDPENDAAIFMILYYKDSNSADKNAVISYNRNTGQWGTPIAQVSGNPLDSFAFPQNAHTPCYIVLDMSDPGAPEGKPIAVGIELSPGTYSWSYKAIKNPNDPLQNLHKPRVTGLTVSPDNPQTVFLGITNSVDQAGHDGRNDLIRGIYRSIDGANSWTKVAGADYEYMAYVLKNKSFIFHPIDPNIIYVGCSQFDAIRKSTDGGNSWYPRVEGLNGINVFGVADTGSRLYTVVQSAIAYNTDNLVTNNWTFRQITDPSGLATANLYGGIEVDPFDEKNVLVGAGHVGDTMSHNGGIYRNTNYGNSASPKEPDWTRVLCDTNPADNKDNAQIMDILFSNTVPGLVFAAAMGNKALVSPAPTKKGIYFSTDHGATWLLPAIYNASDMYSIVGDPYASLIYYGVGGQSSMGGKIVKIIEESPLPRIDRETTMPFPDGDNLYSIDIQRGLDENSAYAFMGTQKGKAYRILLSELRNLNFSAAELVLDLWPLPDGTWAGQVVVAVDPNRPNIIYAGAQGAGIYRSVDSGNVWQEYSLGLESSAKDIYEIKFSPDGNRIYAGTLGSLAINDNQAPVLNQDPPIPDRTVNEGETLTLNISGTDPEGDPISFTLNNNPEFVRLIDNGNGSAQIIISPDFDDAGSCPNIFIQVSDRLRNDSDDFNLVINNVNRPPVIESFSPSIPNPLIDEGSSLEFSVVATDVDTDDLLTYTWKLDSAVVGTGSSYTYNPGYDAAGYHSIDVVVDDGKGGSVPQHWEVTVNDVQPNNPPVAYSRSIKTNEDTPVSGSLPAADPDGDNIIDYIIVDNPTHGSLTGSGANRTYTPNPNYHGEDSFTFNVQDERGAYSTKVGTITITINSVNDQPIANPQAVTTDEDTLVEIVLTGSDIDGTIVGYQPGNPSHGILSGTAPNLIYTPDSNYYGHDSFTFTVIDNEGGSSGPAEVVITINSVNDKPIANSQTVTTDEDSAVNIILTGLDTDGTVVAYTPGVPSHGTLSSTGASLIYTPAANYNGADSFTFTVTDNQGTVSDAAQVTININAVNDAPVITNFAPQNQSPSVNEGSSLVFSVTATDPDDQAIYYTWKLDSAVVGTGLSYTYNPGYDAAGAHTVDLAVRDNSGGVVPLHWDVTVNDVTSVPNGPSNLTATAISTTQINLAWKDNSNNENGFKIYRRQKVGKNNYTNWQIITTVGANANSYQNTGLSKGTTYEYYVVATNGDGDSLPSNNASATTLKK